MPRGFSQGESSTTGSRPLSAANGHTGDGLRSESAASGPPGRADGVIVQGGLEASGTDLADATVTQITVSRAYTALGSVFRTADEMQGALLDMIA